LTPVFRGYLELVRPANVATALGDVLAGFAVSGLRNPAVLPWLMIASACLYAAGVVLNDVFDRHIDARERPERPIPSGRVTAAGAAWFGGSLLFAGILVAGVATRDALVIASAIAVAIVAYDSWSKQHWLLGPVNMGVCRGLNLILGTTASPLALDARWLVALLPVAYISGVTVLSRGEVSGGQRRAAGVALMLVCAVIGAVFAVSIRAETGRLAALVLSAALAWRVLPAFLTAYRTLLASAIRHAVRQGVVSLVLLDAAIAAWFAGASYSVGLLAVAFLAGWLARSFAVT